MTIYFGSPNVIQTVADALRSYGKNEFDSPTRSTIPMLALLKDAEDLFRKIINEFKFPSNYDVFLEYTVGPFNGRGIASHTDVMLKVGEDALAIEGKWTEKMYEDVKDWPKRGAMKTPNQKAVLEGWLQVLAKRLGRSFNANDFDKEVYQMIHRAASAASTGDRPRLAYFLFKPSPNPRSATPDAVLGKLKSLWTHLDEPESFPFYVVEIETTPLEAYEPLRLLAKGKGTTTDAVVAALQDSKPLFQFGGYTIRKVGQEAGK